MWLFATSESAGRVARRRWYPIPFMCVVALPHPAGECRRGHPVARVRPQGVRPAAIGRGCGVGEFARVERRREGMSAAPGGLWIHVYCNNCIGYARR